MYRSSIGRLLSRILPLVLLSFAGDGPPLTAQSAPAVVGVRAVVRYQPSNRLDSETRFPAYDHERDRRHKASTDSIYRAHAQGAYEFEKVWYRSRIGDLDIPAYLFTPPSAAADARLPVLVWVHGGVHADWGPTYLPFVKEAVARGYVVIAPDYRGSTGYGPEFYQAIDYGGYEIDDVISAVDYVREAVPQADPERVGIMGWSHGGLIAAHAVFREDHPFSAAIAIAPVTNLVFRLAYKGPAYQALFTRQARIGALPHERPDVYIERSPVYQVDGLDVPFMVHVATNDRDVDFVESEMLINALKIKKPALAEVKVYENPPGGHDFSRLVDANYQPLDSPVMVDSWAHAWAFFGRHLADGESD